MKAIVQSRYGSADVLALSDVEKPTLGERDVLVKVHAAGLDPGVWHLMTGLPYLVRLGFGLRKPRVHVLGMDVAGQVEAVGTEVTRVRLGDEVFGAGHGAFAEYARVREDRLVWKPPRLTFEQAAAMPTSGCTALQGLRDQGHVEPGRQVLITGAAGGVGSFAVQIARALGAEVTGVCSGTKTSLVRSLGAEHAIDYTREDFADGRQQWDVILDTAGQRPLSHLRRALAPRGTLVIVGGEGGGRWLGGTHRQVQAMALSPFVSQRLVPFLARITEQDLVVLAEFAETGKVTPVIDRTYPLAEVPAAIRQLEAGHARGKIVITLV